jgi:two-component system phosphate regulon response regulator PhoB
MSSGGPILVVDDEEDLLKMVELHLQGEGFDTLSASSGQEALAIVEDLVPSLVVLDWMLPDVPGTEVCRRLRANPATQFVPIIMLTARDHEIDRVVGFEVGADDYVMKSLFSMRELVLRIRAVLRRAPTGSGASTPVPVPVAALAEEVDRLVTELLIVDCGAHRVWVAGDEVLLTATEFKLLETLVRRSGRVQTRGVLLKDVWEMPPHLNTRTVDTHVKRLREKLGVAADHVETVRGVGYRFNKSIQAGGGED